MVHGAAGDECYGVLACVSEPRASDNSTKAGVRDGGFRGTDTEANESLLEPFDPSTVVETCVAFPFHA